MVLTVGQPGSLATKQPTWALTEQYGLCLYSGGHDPLAVLPLERGEIEVMKQPQTAEPGAEAPNGRPSRALLRLVRAYRCADGVGRRTIELALEDCARNSGEWQARRNRGEGRGGGWSNGVDWLRELEAIARVEVRGSAPGPACTR